MEQAFMMTTSALITIGTFAGGLAIMYHLGWDKGYWQLANKRSDLIQRLLNEGILEYDLPNIKEDMTSLVWTETGEEFTF